MSIIIFVNQIHKKHLFAETNIYLYKGLEIKSARNCSLRISLCVILKSMDTETRVIEDTN